MLAIVRGFFPVNIVELIIFTTSLSTQFVSKFSLDPLVNNILYIKIHLVKIYSIGKNKLIYMLPEIYDLADRCY